MNSQKRAIPQTAKYELIKQKANRLKPLILERQPLYLIPHYALLINFALLLHLNFQRPTTHYQLPKKMTFLCLASYFKGNRFLEQCKADGGTVFLLTIESALKEAWARHACDDVFAVNNFHDRRNLINVVAYLMRTRKIDRIVALDDFDVEVGAFLREHFRM